MNKIVYKRVLVGSGVLGITHYIGKGIYEWSNQDEIKKS